jgi:hypothetical protein
MVVCISTKKKAAYLLLGITASVFLFLCAGCGIDSTRYIEPPAANPSTTNRYSFRHSASIASASMQNIYGYEILYRLYTNADAMQADYATIESYKSSLPTGVYTKMIQSLGYQRITLPEFNKDVLVIKDEYPGTPGGANSHNSNLGSYDAEIALDFTAGLDSVKITVNDNVNAPDSLIVYRGAVGTIIINQGKRFYEIKQSDSDVKNTSAGAVDNVYLQAYVFSVGLSDDLITYFYSVPSFLGSTINCPIIL